MKNNSPIQVLLIEDSAFMRIVLSDFLRGVQDIELIDTATNGKEGVEKTVRLQPDVVISDMMMPDFDGVYVVKEIMRRIPTPVLLLSGLEKSSQEVFEALENGAFDFLEKPKGNIKVVGEQLAALIRAAAKAEPENAGLIQKQNTNVHTFGEQQNYDVIVVGASTGGPGAIESLLMQLPCNIAIPVIIAQHMPEAFIVSFAQRLERVTPFKVQVVGNGTQLAPGTIYMAPGRMNTALQKAEANAGPRTRLVKRQYKEFNSPSVDCLMETAAEQFGHRVMGVVLTGMGKDGTKGLRAIQENGGMTIAQDEASAVVYGMPKSAWESGAASYRVSLQEMGGFITSCL